METLVKKTTEEINAEILRERMEIYNKKESARVGDFLKLPNGDYHRFSYNWGDQLQTSSGGSYYLSVGSISMGGSLDSGVKRDDLIQLDEMREGEVWFFSRNEARAHNGVYFKTHFRVFEVKKGGDLSGVRIVLTKSWFDEMRNYCNQYGYLRAYTHEEPVGCGYKITVTCGGSSHTAFRNGQEFSKWLAERGLTTTIDNGVGMKIEGIYRVVSTMNIQYFESLIVDKSLPRTTIQCNGQMPAVILTGDDGVKTIVHLNPNTDYRKYL